MRTPETIDARVPPAPGRDGTVPAAAGRRTLALGLAASIVVFGHGSLAYRSWRNRTTTEGGVVELTERELRLEREGGESTVVFLRPVWTSEPGGRSPTWLDAAKLASLGFDCRLAASDPGARAFYRALPERLVYVLLRIPAADPEFATASGPSRWQWVDADLDPQALRRRHSDSTRCVVTRGVVRCTWRAGETGDDASEARLGGRLSTLVPDRVYLPAPYAGWVRDLEPRFERDPGSGTGPPRYRATVAWGARYEPWVREFRLAAEGSAAVVPP